MNSLSLRYRIGRLPTIAAVIAIIFGIVTMAAGIGVLGGSNPGYTVYLPLLLYNTAMGAVYVLVGVLAWRRSNRGLYGCIAVVALNLVVLCALVLLYKSGGDIAMTSLQAMSFRTVVWAVLLVMAAQFGRAGSGASPSSPA